MSGTIVCWSTGILRCNTENDIGFNALLFNNREREKHWKRNDNVCNETKTLDINNIVFEMTVCWVAHQQVLCSF